MSFDCGALAKTLSLFVGMPVRVAGGEFVAEVSPYAEERELVARAVASRRAEFFSGRFYARHLLGELGCAAAPILRGDKGEPLWPRGVIGSISHDLGQVIVAVMASTEKSGMGIDLLLEPARVDASLTTLIARPNELNALATIAGSLPVLALVFSVKESVVKAVSPSISEYMDLLDIELSIVDSEIHAYIATTSVKLRCLFVPIEGGLLTAAVLVN